MLKRTLYFGKPYYLSTRLGQLLIANGETGELLQQAPIEDIGCMLIDHREISLSSTLIQKLSEANVALVVCNEKHMPASMLFHLDSHQIQAEKYAEQLASSLPLKKQLWQQVVKTKIKNQAIVLEAAGKEHRYLDNLRMKVNSGDNTNVEGQASRAYWPLLFGKSFRRMREGAPPNPSLNYGYAIIRAAMARAIAGAGLLPTLGIHHHNRYNSFPLADDLMEPYRPLVDWLVFRQKKASHSYHHLTTDRKAEFLSVLQADIKTDRGISPVMVAMQQTAWSLSKCFGGKSRKLFLPELINLE